VVRTVPIDKHNYDKITIWPFVFPSIYIPIAFFLGFKRSFKDIWSQI
jgi:hypothetical protein